MTALRTTPFAARALLVCAAILAAFACALLGADRAHAQNKQAFPDLGTVVVTVPVGVSGTLLPVYLEELVGFPADAKDGTFTATVTSTSPGAITSASVDENLVLTLFANGGGPSNSHDVVSVRVENMAAYEDATFRVEVHFKPKLERFSVKTVNATYDPAKVSGSSDSKRRYFGYNGTSADDTKTVDAIDAYFTNMSVMDERWLDWGKYPNTEPYYRTGGWRYLYRDASGNPLPDVDPYQGYDVVSQRVNIQKNGETYLEAPTDAGDYQLIIAGAYVHQTFGGSGDLNILPRDAAGWTVIEFTVDRAASLSLQHPGVTRPDSKDSTTIDLSKTPDMPKYPNGGPVYTVASFSKNGLANATIDEHGTLTLTGNGLAQGKTDMVVVKLTGMGNYEDSTINVNVSYAAKPAGVINGVAPATGLTYNANPQKGYTGAPQAEYTPVGALTLATYDGPFDLTYTGTTADGSAYGPTAQAPSAAGNYRVTFSLPADAPCIAEPLTLDFAIASRALSATVNTAHTSAAKTYDGSAAFDNVALSLSGVAGPDALAATASGNAVEASAGTHAFLASSVALTGNSKGNYTLVPADVTGNVGIAKAPLAFRAEDASMTAGNAVPPLNYTVEGLKGSDQVTQAPRLAVEGDTTKAGTYAIVVAGGTVDNQASYDITYRNATLTVAAGPTPKPVPDPKPMPEPSKPKALAPTGDTALPGLLALAAGTAALAVGVAAARIRTNRRR